VDPEVLDTVYLPHFERVVREGVASVMSAYNSLNGEWCSENRGLLTTILKERWGFDGFVLSDFVFAVHDGPKAVNAGLDLEMPSPLCLGPRLARAVRRGQVSMERIDDAVLRLIRQQLRFAEAGDGDYGPEVVASAKHRALAREVATKAIVLLRNEPVEGRAGDGRGVSARPVLPVAAAELRRLAVIGRLAAAPNTGDHGSSDVTAPYVVTPLEGMRAALEPLGVEVVHDPGDDPARAAAVAAAADVALVVVGYDYRDEGEFMAAPMPFEFLRHLPRPPLKSLPKVVRKVIKAGASLLGAKLFGRGGLAGGGDRKSLTLHESDEALLLAVAAANKRTVAVLMCGSAVLMERWRHAVPGILILWYPGMEGGHALADIVLGRQAPTGRLPFAIPTSEKHLPFFDPDAKVVEHGPLHGQALLDHLGVPAAYPYGFGLSYEE
jgi:beta-glucosidase